MTDASETQKKQKATKVRRKPEGESVLRPTFTVARHTPNEAVWDANQQGSNLLQRQCACGTHTIGGSECDDCRHKRESSLLQRADINNLPKTFETSSSVEPQHSPATNLTHNFGHVLIGEKVPNWQPTTNPPILQHSIQRQSQLISGIVQRTPIDDVKNKCITRQFPRQLDNLELQQTIQALTDHMQTLQPTDAAYQAAADNMQILRSEVAYREREQLMTDHLTDISGAGSTADHRRETDELIAYARSQLETGTFPQMIDTFIQQTVPDADEKVRILGRVVVEAERMEFFLGNIYHRGANDWEVDAAGRHTEDRGHMVDSYTGGNAMHWCSRFATTALSRVRGSNTVLASSGYKIANPHESGWNIDLDYNAAQGGDFSGMTHGSSATAASNPWAALRQRLTQIDGDASIADKEQAKRQAIDNVFSSEIRPQPGDMMIITEPGAKQNSFDGGHSHTTTIERLDGYTVSTIEGNASDRVTGHVYDLTNPAHVGKIIFIARPSLASGRTAAEEAQIGAGVAAGTAYVGEQELLEPLQQINRMLEEFAANAGYINIVPQNGDHSVSNLD